MNTARHSISFPGFAVGGGIQTGVKGGERGAWFFDVNFMRPLDETLTSNVININFPNPGVLHWNRFVFGLGIGYKIGFIER
jgi:hypothetical protein